MFSDQEIEEIKKGHAVLLLGAGASADCHKYNDANAKVPMGGELAQSLCSDIGLSFEDDPLRDVYEAAIQKKGPEWIKEYFQNTFLSIKPSSDLEKIFNYPWRRVYTLNIDDSIKNIHKNIGVQDRNIINGVADDRQDWLGHSTCQVVHLHGAAWQIDRGLVFSEGEYGASYRHEQGWYGQFQSDFRSYPVFLIGTRMDEAFLLALMRGLETLGVGNIGARLIVPSELSPVRKASLESAGVRTTNGKLSDFVNALEAAFGSRFDLSRAVAEETTIEERLINSFSKRDLDALSGLRPLNGEELKRVKKLPIGQKRSERASFFNGFGPTWSVVSEKAFAWLEQFNRVFDEIDSALEECPIVVLLGPAGSGKSTIQKSYVVERAAVGGSIFEHRPTPAPLMDVLASLQRFQGEERATLSVEDLHVFSGDLALYYNRSNPDQKTQILTSCRQSDWNSRIKSQIGAFARTVKVKQYTKNDENVIVDAISKYYIAPEFNKLTKDQRIRKIQSKGRRQLLFALREASQGDNFDNIVRGEVESITDPNLYSMFLIICVATAARVGISLNTAGSMWDGVASQSGKITTQLLKQLLNLEGMINLSSSGELRVRHDTYARIVLDKHAKIEDVWSAFDTIIQYFAQFDVPIITNISKKDSHLFKYVLNNANVLDTFRHNGDYSQALRIYEVNEERLQLDGHYWLQYGLALRKINRPYDAFEKLNRSIEAFGRNEYAKHALAQQKLMIAALTDCHKKYDVNILIDEGVSYLEERHLSGVIGGVDDRFDEEEYPLSALARYHPNALISLGRKEEAKEVARKYFNWITDIERRHGSTDFGPLKERLIKFVQFDVWDA